MAFWLTAAEAATPCFSKALVLRRRGINFSGTLNLAAACLLGRPLSPTLAASPGSSFTVPGFTAPLFFIPASPRFLLAAGDLAGLGVWAVLGIFAGPGIFAGLSTFAGLESLARGGFSPWHFLPGTVRTDLSTTPCVQAAGSDLADLFDFLLVLLCPLDGVEGLEADDGGSGRVADASASPRLLALLALARPCFLRVLLLLSDGSGGTVLPPNAVLDSTMDTFFIPKPIPAVTLSLLRS